MTTLPNLLLLSTMKNIKQFFLMTLPFTLEKILHYIHFSFFSFFNLLFHTFLKAFISFDQLFFWLKPKAEIRLNFRKRH